MGRSWRERVRQLSPLVLVTVGVVAVGLLLVPHLVVVRLVFVRPPVGDVSGVVGNTWDVSLAVATFGSFLLAIFNYYRPPDDEQSQPMVSGDNNDVDEQSQMLVSGNDNDITINVGIERTDLLSEESDTPRDHGSDGMDEVGVGDTRAESDDDPIDEP